MKKLIVALALAASASCLAEGVTAEPETNRVTIALKNGKTATARVVNFPAIVREHGKRVSIERDGNVVTWGFEDGYKVTLALPKAYVMDASKCAGVHRTDIKRMTEEGKARRNGGAK